MRWVALVVAAAMLAWLLVTGARGATEPRRTIGHGQIAFAFDRRHYGHGPEWWAARWRRERRAAALLRRQLHRARRVLLAKPTVVEAINLACATYGSCSTLWRRARCETGGTFDPLAYNATSGAAGLFQFLGSTWRTTPYRVFSVSSPYANALAAGWMHAHGRGGEWACR